jgi:hypothetical protein
MQGIPHPSSFHLVNIGLHAAVAVQVGRTALRPFAPRRAAAAALAHCSLGLLPVSSFPVNTGGCKGSEICDAWQCDHSVIWRHSFC